MKKNLGKVKETFLLENSRLVIVTDMMKNDIYNCMEFIRARISILRAGKSAYETTINGIEWTSPSTEKTHFAFSIPQTLKANVPIGSRIQVIEKCKESGAHNID